MALCLESQMGACQPTRLCPFPQPHPPAPLPCPPSVSWLPVRTTRPPGLQRRLLFLARHIPFASHPVWCGWKCSLIKRSSHPEAVWFTYRMADLSVAAVIKGEAAGLVLWRTRQLTFDLASPRRPCLWGIHQTNGCTFLTLPRLRFRGFHLVFASTRVAAQPALLQQGLNLAASNTRQCFHPGGRVGTCPRAFKENDAIRNHFYLNSKHVGYSFHSSVQLKT